MIAPLQTQSDLQQSHCSLPSQICYVYGRHRTISAMAPGADISSFGPLTHPAIRYTAQGVALRQSATERSNVGHISKRLGNDTNHQQA